MPAYDCRQPGCMTCQQAFRRPMPSLMTATLGRKCRGYRMVKTIDQDTGARDYFWMPLSDIFCEGEPKAGMHGRIERRDGQVYFVEDDRLALWGLE